MKLTMTERQCPEVWDGETDDGRDVEVRCRHGRTTITVHYGYPDQSTTVLARDGADVVADIEAGRILL